MKIPYYTIKVLKRYQASSHSHCARTRIFRLPKHIHISWAFNPSISWSVSLQTNGLLSQSSALPIMPHYVIALPQARD